MVKRRASKGVRDNTQSLASFRRAVLVTGASGGIGRAICLAFANAGWFVGMQYHREKAVAETLFRQLEGAGGAGACYDADVREAHSVHQMVQQFCRDVTAPSAFVCNAGVGSSSFVLKQRVEDWLDIMETNLTGTFHCLRAMAPSLLAQGGGSIVVVSSHAAFHGSTGQAAYAASKAGLVGLVKTAALEWGPHNIRLNLVLPGWHLTGLTQHIMPAEWEDHALRRPPSLSEVAQTVFYLATLKDVSGQIWNCDSRHV